MKILIREAKMVSFIINIEQRVWKENEKKMKKMRERNNKKND